MKLSEILFRNPVMGQEASRSLASRLVLSIVMSVVLASLYLAGVLELLSVSAIFAALVVYIIFVLAKSSNMSR